MGRFRFNRRNRLIATIAISSAFFVAEITTGFYTHSLTLIADAFHNLSDLLGFVVSLTALQLSEGSTPAPPGYTFGWQRAKLVGAFFNGIFVLALGPGILVQAIERFVNITPIENPKLVLIIGCVGLALNVLVLSFLHEHDHGHGQNHGTAHSHSHGHGHSHDHNNDKGNQTQIVDLEAQVFASGDNEGSAFNPIASHIEHKHKVASAAHSRKDLGMMGAFIHVVGDAINNVGVIVSALIIWRVEGEKRYYADPAIGVFIAIMIFFTAIPLTKEAWQILMQTAPEGINIKDVQECIEKIPGVDSVHELHIWRLDQEKPIASAHIVLKYNFNGKWHTTAKTIIDCFHDYYGIHSVTLQQETAPKPTPPADSTAVGPEGLPIKKNEAQHCQLLCNCSRSEMRCCRYTLLRQSSG